MFPIFTATMSAFFDADWVETHDKHPDSCWQVDVTAPVVQADLPDTAPAGSVSDAFARGLYLWHLYELDGTDQVLLANGFSNIEHKDLVDKIRDPKTRAKFADPVLHIV